MKKFLLCLATLVAMGQIFGTIIIFSREQVELLKTLRHTLVEMKDQVRAASTIEDVLNAVPLHTSPLPSNSALKENCLRIANEISPEENQALVALVRKTIGSSPYILEVFHDLLHFAYFYPTIEDATVHFELAPRYFINAMNADAIYPRMLNTAAFAKALGNSFLFNQPAWWEEPEAGAPYYQKKLRLLNAEKTCTLFREVSIPRISEGLNLSRHLYPKIRKPIELLVRPPSEEEKRISIALRNQMEQTMSIVPESYPNRRKTQRELEIKPIAAEQQKIPCELADEFRDLMDQINSAASQTKFNGLSLLGTTLSTPTNDNALDKLSSDKN